MRPAQSLLLPADAGAVPSGDRPGAWTVELIDARRRTGDVLVTRGGWSVSFDTSSETGKVARLTCVRYAPGTYHQEVEWDVMHGHTFPTSDDAECHALNAGRLQWFRDWKASRAVAS